MATSRYGEGSITYDAAKGLYVGRVELGVDAAGRRARGKVKAKTKVALRAKMRELHAARDTGVPVADGRTTTGAWLRTWLTDVLPRTVQPGTVTNYTNVVDAYVVPYVGDVPLVKLTPEHVERMMTALEAKGLSARTVALSRTVLRRALQVAVRRGRLVRNVAALTDAPPRASVKVDDALDASGASAVLTAASGDRLEALAVLVLAVGLREGEALSLRWADVNLDTGTLSVTASKTPAGARTIALPPIATDALRAHRGRLAAEQLAASDWDDHGLVFPSTRGTRMDRRRVLRWWHELTVRAGVGRRRFHASRHTAATLMLNAGVPLEVVSATLGHAGLAITADVYAKVRPQLQRRAADAMETVLGGGR
jgi:integrase